MNANNGVTSSRSDAAMVAVGFSPRIERKAWRVASRRLSHSPVERLAPWTCPHFRRRYATQPGFRQIRGLKPTATIAASLRDDVRNQMPKRVGVNRNPLFSPTSNHTQIRAENGKLKTKTSVP